MWCAVFFFMLLKRVKGFAFDEIEPVNEYYRMCLICLHILYAVVAKKVAVYLF